MAAHASARRTVDERALQTNQIAIIALMSAAFVLGAEAGRWVIAFAGVSMALGAAAPGYGPIQLFYRHVLKRFGIVKPDPQPGDPARTGSPKLSAPAFCSLRPSHFSPAPRRRSMGSQPSY